MMKRDVAQLSRNCYDVVVVGGGIFGICMAWEAASRGLSVALIEKGDFAHATSANSFKLVHGGLRYLQHGDIYRVRESSRERSTLLRIAPHLVKPLPVVMPTYGHGAKGKEILQAGLFFNDIVTFDRNRGINDPSRQIPKGRFITREECLEMFPGLERKDLNGAAIFHDGQMYNPTRLALSFLRSAVEKGAEVANYVELEEFLVEKQSVLGIRAKDLLANDIFDIRGRVTVNAAGPWAANLVRNLPTNGLRENPSFSRDAYFVVPRHILSSKFALALPAKSGDSDALISRGHRHIFLIPWRDYTLVGVWHAYYRGEPDGFGLTEDEIREFIDEVNSAYDSLGLSPGDISLFNAGLILFGDETGDSSKHSFGKRSIVLDHHKEHKIDGLLTVIGVRYTTARGIAEKSVDIIFDKLGRRRQKSQSAYTPIYGGHMESFQDFLNGSVANRPYSLSEHVVSCLVHNYGSNFGKVLKYIDESPAWSETLGNSKVIEAEVIHAVREEMAEKLGDVVFRRTDLGTGGDPGEAALRKCAGLMASELGWSDVRAEKELEEVRSLFSKFSS